MLKYVFSTDIEYFKVDQFFYTQKEYLQLFCHDLPQELWSLLQSSLFYHINVHGLLKYLE